MSKLSNDTIKGVKMKKLISYLTLVLFVFTGILSAQPQKQSDNPVKGKGIFSVLNLTTEQEKQYKDIRYEQQKKAIDLRSQIQKNRLEIKHMIAGNNIDEKKILSLTDSNSKLEAELKNSSVKSWLSIHKILTPEQQKIWANHFKGMRGEIRNGFRDRINKRFDKRGQMRMERFEGRGPIGNMEFEDNEELFGMFEPDEIDSPMEPEL